MPAGTTRQGHRRGQELAMPGRAVEALFRALSSHAPDVLAELANSEDDATIQHWAESHNLQGAAVLEFSKELVRWWSLHPSAKKELRTGWRFSGAGSYAPYNPEERLYREQLRWPDPADETARDWKNRAAEIYKRLRSFRPPIRQRNGLEPETLNRYATWFVQVRVLGLSVSTLVQRGRGSRSMFDKGISEFATMAEISSNSPLAK